MLPTIGLYYPYIHFRNEAWLKTAALYQTKMARVVPSNYPLADSRIIRELADELDFIVPVDPVATAQAVAPLFIDLLEQHGPALRNLYAVPEPPRQLHELLIRVWPPIGRPRANPAQFWRPIVNTEPSWPNNIYFVGSVWWGAGTSLWDRPVAGLYWDEIHEDLRDALFATGLASSTRHSLIARAGARPWVAMHSRLAWFYKCVFIAELARSSRFLPVTDQPEAHLALDHWDADQAAAVLLDPSSLRCGPADPVTAAGLLALRIVIPEGLDDLPVEKIVKIRRRHRAEFEAFNLAVAETVATLQSELADVTVAEARERYVQIEVERRFTIPLEELRRAMKGLSIDTSLGVASLKFELPAAVSMAAGATLSDQPLLGGVLGATFALVGLRRISTQKREALKASSPAAYLLSLEHGLEPSSLLRRLTGRP